MILFFLDFVVCVGGVIVNLLCGVESSIFGQMGEAPYRGRIGKPDDRGA